MHEVITQVVDNGSMWYTLKLFVVSYLVANSCYC